MRWGWTRALSWKSKMEKEYSKWRKNKKFVKFDIEVDRFINNNLNNFIVSAKLKYKGAKIIKEPFSINNN